MVPFAPLPLGRAIVASFFPAGAYTIFFCPLSGSGAVADSSPICTNRLLKARQLRRKRHGSAGRGAQPETAKQITAQCSHRAASLFFSYTGRGAFPGLEATRPAAPKGLGINLPRRCKHSCTESVPSRAGLGSIAFQKEMHSPRGNQREHPAEAGCQAHLYTIVGAFGQQRRAHPHILPPFPPRFL